MFAVRITCLLLTVATCSAQDSAAQQYIGMLENFAGFAERHWNEKEVSYDAAGSGVTWARGNGGVCLVNAVLLTEFPERELFSPQKIPRGVLLDHVRRTLRSLCLQSKSCTDSRAADGINGAVRRDFSAKAGEVLQESVCVYQPLLAGRAPGGAKSDANTLRIGDWKIRSGEDGGLSMEK